MLNFFCWKNHFLGYVEFFPWKKPFFFKKVLLSAEMLNMLDHAECLFPKKCFFLLKCWICWICWISLPLVGPFWPPIDPKKSTYSTYSTFQQKEAHFSDTRSNMIQHIQHFSRKKHIFGTCWFFSAFLGKGFSAERTTFLPMLNFSAERATFWVMLIFFPWKKPFFQKNASFCWNVEYVRSCWMPFPKKVLLSAEMLNMLNYFASSWSLLASHRPKKIQHIQHIQHFSRKKHIFQTLDPTWSNIFNISAERSTFLIPLAFFLLKCWICWIFWGGHLFNPEKDPKLQK